MSVNEFVSMLSHISSTDIFYNPYTDDVKSGNLLLYLSYMQKDRPKHLFVGEAPGYKGGALSGVPFTDEYRLTTNGRKGCLPLQHMDYQIISEMPSKERSASVLWETFVSENYFPLIWNIFPFHPHKSGDSACNRKPTAGEIEAYRYVIQSFIELFPSIERIFALGRVPESELRKMDIEVQYIRHPSYGGAAICRDEIIKLARAN